VGHFFFELFFEKKKKYINLKFYKSFGGINVISPILPFDLIPNPDGGGYCIKLEVRGVKLRVFKRYGGHFETCGSLRIFCEVSPQQNQCSPNFSQE
jgi:hypothetical protein